MALMLEDWLPAFDGEASSAATFEDGLLSLAVIDAAHRSAEGADGDCAGLAGTNLQSEHGSSGC